MTLAFTPTPYEPGPRPLLEGSEMDYVAQELRRVAASLADLCRMVPQASQIVPLDPVEGMIRFAKSPWRPIGGTVDTWVTYVNGAWVAL